MSMTRAEAIEILERRTTIPGDGYTFEQINDALDLALAALRFPARGQVERMRYPWERIVDAYGNTEGFLCECGHMDNSASNFCNYCGLPKTDEAVDILWQRWKEAVGDETQ